MNTHGEDVDERVVGGGRPVRRTRVTVLAAGAVTLVAVLLGTAVGLGAVVPPALAVGEEPPPPAVAPAPPAFAAGEETPPPAAPSAPVTSTPVPQDHLAPSPGNPTTSPIGRPVTPTIADPGDITSRTVRFHGTGTAGHALRVTGRTSIGPVGCSATVTDAGTWSCFAAVASGPGQVFAVEDRSAPELGGARTPASDVIVPPVITTARPTNGPVSGRGRPGSVVSVSVAGSSTDRSATVGRDGRWTVTLGTSSGSVGVARLTVTATQTASTADGYRSDLRSAASSPVTVTLDRSAPPAPRITSPGAGDRVHAQPVTVAGTGEPRAVLTVSVDRGPGCRVDVPASGRWSCTTAGTALPAGPRIITASQRDAAGNSSRSSARVMVTVVPGTGAPTGTASGSTPGTATGTPGNGTPTGTAGSTGGTPGGGSDVAGAGGRHGSSGEPGSVAPGGGSSATGSSATGSGAGPAGPHGLDWSGPAGDWTASTTYDATVPTIQTAFSWRTALVAAAVAGGFLVLVAGPLAVVAGAARGRLRSPFAALLGRNRTRADRRHGEDPLPTAVAITVAVLVVGLCTVLGVGVSLEARYVRLAIAVLTGAAVLATTVVLASRRAAGAERETIGFRVSPWLVVAALAACGITRALDLSPAVIVGVVLLPVVRPQLDPAASGARSTAAVGAGSATWRSVALLVVAAAGWVLHSLAPGSGLWGSIVSEFATTLCVGGLGAVVATVLPLPGSAGQALLGESRGRYAAIAAVAVALAAAVYSGAEGTHVSPVALAVLAAGCTAAAVASQLWLRAARSDRAA
jgi:hypothetical protein